MSPKIVPERRGTRSLFVIICISLLSFTATSPALPGLGGATIDARGVFEGEKYDQDTPYAPICDPTSDGEFTDDVISAGTSKGRSAFLPNTGCGIIFDNLVFPVSGSFSQFRAEVTGPGSSYTDRVEIYVDGVLAATSTFTSAPGSGFQDRPLNPTIIVPAGTHEVDIRLIILSGHPLGNIYIDCIKFQEPDAESCFYPKPNADFEWGSPACSMQPLTFTDKSSIAPPGSLAMSTWDFGDGPPSPDYSGTYVSSITHTFTSAGAFTVTLTVEDTLGQTATKSKTVGISPCPPTADFSWSPTSPCAQDLVTFTDTSTPSPGGSFTSSVWDFGDGVPSPDYSGPYVSSISHTFASPGTYLVTLTVTDSFGKSATATKSITVRDCDPVADFAWSPNPACIGEPITFTDMSSAVPPAMLTAWAWDFGDGTTGSGSSVVHTYLLPSTYTVLLTVTDSTGRTASIGRSVPVIICTGMPPEVHAAAGSAAYLTETAADGPGCLTVGPPSIGDFIVSHGYDTSGKPSVATMCFDGTTGSWTPMASAGTARAHAAGVWHSFTPASIDSTDDLYIVVGGAGPACTGPSGTCETVEIFSSAGTWSYGPSLPVASADLAAAAIIDFVFVLGGRQCISPLCSAPALDTLQIFQIGLATPTWVFGPSMPTPRTELAVATAGDCIYAIGGNTGGSSPTDLATIDEYCSTGTWTMGAVPPMPVAVSNAVADWCGDRLYVVGGTTGGADAGIVQIYDSLMGVWLPSSPASVGGDLAVSKSYDGTQIFLTAYPGDPAATTMPC